MADWLTYSLSDFLPFSRATYLRLFELYNVRDLERAVWAFADQKAKIAGVEADRLLRPETLHAVRMP